MTIALMFLMKGDHSRPTLWYPFIDSEHYNIYCHPKNRLKDEKFQPHIVSKIIPTAWGDKSLVEATLILMQEGLKDISNSHFVLLSDTCCPLYDPEYTKTEIEKMGDNVCRWFDQKIDPDRKNVPSYLKPHIVKHHQWIILTRQTVETILEYDRLKEWNGSVPDEQYFGTMLKWLRIPFDSRMTTFADWAPNAWHPKSYYSISSQLRDKAKRHNSLFIRKII